MAKKNNDIITISENLIKIDILDNLWDVLKKCRESYYYLRSLKAMLESGTLLVKKSDENENRDTEMKVNESHKNMLSLEDEFNIIDSLLLNGGDTSSQTLAEEEAATTKQQLVSDDSIKFMEEYKIFNIIISAINLKEKIDKLQLSILKFLYDTVNELNADIAKDYEKLNFLYISTLQRSLTKIRFEHSTDEDKINTYEISCKNNDVRRDLKIKNIKLPYYIRSRDYSYNLDKLRFGYDEQSKLNIELISMLQTIKKEEELQKLNKRQYYFNITVTIFTVLSTLVGISQLIMPLLDK